MIRLICKAATCSAVALLALTGCSADSFRDNRTAATASPDIASPTPSATKSPRPKRTATTPPRPAGAYVQIICSGTQYQTYQAAWPAQHDHCFDGDASGTPNAKEAEALNVAYGAAADVRSLRSLYGMCAKNGPNAFTHVSEVGSPAQVDEVRGALLICPDHPQRATIEQFLAKADHENQLRTDGRIFGPGVLRVGSEVQPGTYEVTDVEGCYWERTDVNGETIDNFFTNGAARVQVTIRATDYAFNSERCGVWRPVG